MTATYTWDVFSSLDGYGSTNGDWGGYWGKQGPELLDRRLGSTAQSSGWSSGRRFLAFVEMRPRVPNGRSWVTPGSPG